ncbi:MAG: AraC family transcriptional regulator [Ruminococcaceae bacterium]|nr:AraC family transcriptional regulator [Oscillospiraceae bacterium]
MKVGPYEGDTAQRKFAYSRVDVIKLDTKCLFAGKLERIREWEEKPHSHPFCEILFVLSGEGEVTVGGRSYPIGKDDLIIYNPNVVHKERTSASSGLELAFFGITNFKIENLPADFLIGEHASPVLHTKKDEEKFAFYFRSLVEEVSADQPYSELMAKYWARLILIGILRLANVSEAKFVTNAIFTRIHQYLTKHFAEISCMEDICTALNINKYYLSHIFKKYMGTPPMQYVTLRRIAYAKQLLQETDLPASAVGEVCGYRDRVLFFKAFRKAEGMTPGEFRRRARERLPASARETV